MRVGFFLFRLTYAHVQFESYEQHHAVYEKPDQKCDKGSDGTVEFIVGTEIIDVSRKSHRGQDDHKGANNTSRRDEFKFASFGRCKIVKRGNAEKSGYQNNEPFPIEKQCYHEFICQDIS